MLRLRRSGRGEQRNVVLWHDDARTAPVHQSLLRAQALEVRAGIANAPGTGHYKVDARRCRNRCVLYPRRNDTRDAPGICRRH